MERDQTKKMKELLTEYKQLKQEIFGNEMFIVWGKQGITEKEKRYDQLHQLFYPQHRTKDFINPLN